MEDFFKDIKILYKALFKYTIYIFIHIKRVGTYLWGGTMGQPLENKLGGSGDQPVRQKFDSSTSICFY